MCPESFVAADFAAYDAQQETPSGGISHEMPGTAVGKCFLGLDIGSTTVKVVAVDADGVLIFSRYQRHLAEVRATLATMLREASQALPGRMWTVAATGSGAIALATELNVFFVQEVVASSLSIRRHIPDANVAIELGGEDAKLIFFDGGLDQRMNETCAGGTGAFIDHMASFLHTDAAGLDALALCATSTYPIASRCGVFAKTDVLPLLNEGCSRENIAASIMQAVVDQTISGLARGRSITGKVVLLGGPLAFLPSLRDAFSKTLNLGQENAFCPQHAEYFVALGAALHACAKAQDYTKQMPEHCLHTFVQRLELTQDSDATGCLPPLFANAEERAAFHLRHQGEAFHQSPLADFTGEAWLGFDSGSTTIKAVLIDAEGKLLYTSYAPNKGDPLFAAVTILQEIYERAQPGLIIRGAAVTGYGSGLLQAGLRIDIDEVETVAHYFGARFFLPTVSFILDIGGQDIKCMRIRNGSIDAIQLNEACSAGCGSFVETFAKSLNMPLQQFVEAALAARKPVDLGTRCTVFMNSKVKQAQKDGASVGDIAAGLAISVIKNACYKVMKITSTDSFGEHVVAQGGAFANDALLRAFEVQIGRHVVRPDLPGLMGAFGAALIAKERGLTQSTILNMKEIQAFTAENSTARCRHCSNNCLLTVTRFADNRRFISGNRCERGTGHTPQKLPNLYQYKYERLFKYYQPLAKEKAPRGSIGIPRALNIYDNYPLWFTIFTELGFRVELSAASSKEIFFKGYSTIPSQTVCYPAKLTHGHVLDLVEKGVDAIFFPCLQREIKDFSSQDDHYNCPVVIGYPELLANNVSILRSSGIPFIHSFLPMQKDALARRLHEIPQFAHISQKDIEKAVRQGFTALEAYKLDMRKAGEEALTTLREKGIFGLVLAGHPYHVDPAIHHGIAEMVNSCGMAVFTEDSLAHLAPHPTSLRVVDQWTYHARLYRAATFVAESDNLALLHLVSFGCGLDAITADQMEEILLHKGRLYAQIKVDEGSNLGPARIRIRSLLAALRERQGKTCTPVAIPVYKGLPSYTEEMRTTHTILVPQMSPMHFQFLETIFAAEGYALAQLPHVSKEAVELGLRYVNNDSCYPAIVVVGQLLHAVMQGGYDKERVALLISQTGGGCRATNYIAFLRKALVDSRLELPVISFNLGDMDRNPGFRVSRTMLRRMIMGGLYGDVLMRVLHRTRPYELETGSANALAAHWAEHCKEQLIKGKFTSFYSTMQNLVQDFDKLPLRTLPRKPRVGLVGEILLKYHPDANNHTADIIESEGGEVVISDIMDFVMYCLYSPIYYDHHLAGTWQGNIKARIGIGLIEAYRWAMRRALQRSSRFTPPSRFYELARKAQSLISLGHQTGEGWLLAGEMVELLESGVSNILCMQPFGCLPNHITGKGLLKELKLRFPEANIAAVDYDSGASEVNQLNRIKLMMSVAK